MSRKNWKKTNSLMKMIRVKWRAHSRLNLSAAIRYQSDRTIIIFLVIIFAIAQRWIYFTFFPDLFTIGMILLCVDWFYLFVEARWMNWNKKKGKKREAESRSPPLISIGRHCFYCRCVPSVYTVCVTAVHRVCYRM